MRAKPELKFDPESVTELACPACRGDLRASAPTAPPSLICSVCGRAYPIIDGIPVLIVERAERTSVEDKPALSE
jgi:uncharacterized protein YbaR (Trm112 family)